MTGLTRPMMSLLLVQAYVLWRRGTHKTRINSRQPTMRTKKRPMKISVLMIAEDDHDEQRVPQQGDGFEAHIERTHSLSWRKMSIAPTKMRRTRKAYHTCNQILGPVSVVAKYAEVVQVESRLSLTALITTRSGNVLDSASLDERHATQVTCKRRTSTTFTDQAPTTSCHQSQKL